MMIKNIKHTPLMFFRFAAGILLLCAVISVARAGAAPVEAYRSFLRGLLSTRAGNMEAAAGEYERVVLMDGEAAGAWRDLMFIYWQLGRTADALGAAEKVEALSGDVLSVQLQLGSFYLQAGQTARARACWEQALKLDPDNETAMLYLAALHSSSDSPAKAAAYWQKFIEKEPDSAEGYFQLGVTQEKMGKTDKARESFLKVLSIKPDSSEAHLSLAQLYEKEGKVVAAAQEYERYIELNPDNTSVLLYMGGLYYRMKNYAAAEAAFDRAKKANPADTTAYFWLGVLAEERRDWDAAIANMEFIYAKDPSASILTRLSYYYSAKKEFKKANAYLEKLVELDPQSPAAHYMLGLGYFDAKKYRQSERSFQKALSISPEAPEIHFHLGVLYDQWKKFDKAVPAFREAIRLKPDYPQALNYLGYSLADRDMNLEEAEELISRAVERDPDNGSYRDSLGWVYFKRGKLDDAARELGKAVQLFPDAIIWEHLGDVRVQMGDFDAAWDAYRSAADLVPASRALRKKIKALDKQVLPGTLQRKMLKRAEGNLRQLSSYKAHFAVSGAAGNYNLRCTGIFQYLRPDRWRADILGSFMAPQMIVIKDSGTVHVVPASLSDAVTPQHRMIFDLLSGFLNAALAVSFDDDSVRIEASRGNIRYIRGNESLLLDADNGEIREYSAADGLTVIFKAYVVEDGLHLPREVTVRLPNAATAVTIRFQAPSVNGLMAPEVFSAPLATGQGN